MSDARPDPALDLVGSLRWIMDRLEVQEHERGERRVSARRAALLMGFSDNYLHQPWRIPGFGAAGTRHSLSDWKEWLARPEAERRAEWDTMPVGQRRRARGAVSPAPQLERKGA